MKCPNCGNEIALNAKFCRECGIKIVAETEALTGKVCVKCGEQINIDAVFCNNCGTPVDNSPLVEKNPVQVAKKVDRKKDRSFVFLIALLIIVVIGCGTAVWVVYNKNTPKEASYNYTDSQKSTESSENAKENEENAENIIDAAENEIVESKSTQSPSVNREAITNVNEKVTNIKALYYETQNNLDGLKIDTSQTGVKKYYNDIGEVVRMDISADRSNQYTRCYYFNGSKLYFAFIFSGKNENRLYFDSDCLFRWIDEQKSTHDNEFDKSDFLYWENFALAEVENKY